MIDVIMCKDQREFIDVIMCKDQREFIDVIICKDQREFIQIMIKDIIQVKNVRKHGHYDMNGVFHCISLSRIQ